MTKNPINHPVNYPPETVAPPNVKQERWILAIAFLLVIGMICCALAAVFQMVASLIPGWNGAYLIFFSIFISLEVYYSRQVLKRVHFPEREWVSFRVAEWIFILISLKVAFYCMRGFNQLIFDLPHWRENFLSNFFSAEYLIALMIVFLIWGISTFFAVSLSQIGLDEKELILEEDGVASLERVQARSALLNGYLILGGILIVSITVLKLVGYEMGIQTKGILFLVLAYFLAGLGLLSLVHLATMETRSIVDHVTLQKGISWRWLAYSIGFTLLLGIITSLLPTHYSVGLFDMIRTLLQLILSIIGFLLFLVIVPFAYLWNLLMGLLSGSKKSDQSTPVIPNVPVIQAPATPLAWLEFLKSLIFWIVLIGLVSYSIYYYLHSHKELLERLRRLPFFAFITYLWRGLLDWLRKARRELYQGIQAGWQRLRGEERSKREALPWQLLRLRRLSPRQRIIYYYLAMVRRGVETGISRSIYQTPYAYSQTLVQGIHMRAGSGTGIIDTGDIQEGIDQLTDQFVEARYSLHEISIAQVSALHPIWLKIQHALRRFHQRNKEQPSG